MSDPDIPENKLQLSIAVIATNRYVEFLPDLLKSIDRFVLQGQEVEAVVFTNELDYVEKISLDLKRIKIRIVAIAPYSWPDASLLRYKIFEEHQDLLLGKHIMYMDADTVVVQSISLDMLDNALSSYEVALVQHPGYFNRSLFVRWVLKTKFGPWETNRASAAFVRFSQRNKYVCGGVWFGTRKAIIPLVAYLSNSVAQDQKQNLVAKWHDESHLNMWLVKNHANLLEPRWAFAPGYKNLKALTPLIEVIEKGDGFNSYKKLS